jgi:adenylyltransferase/sulfurtransferase
MTFKISGVLLRFTDYRDRVEIDAPTVGSALRRLVERYPQLEDVLFEADGSLRFTHRLFLNGDMIDEREVDRPLAADDRVDILTAISGG